MGAVQFNPKLYTTQGIEKNPFSSMGSSGSTETNFQSYELVPNLVAGDSYYTNHPDKTKTHGKTTFMCMG